MKLVEAQQSFRPDPPSEASQLLKLLADAFCRYYVGALAWPVYSSSALTSFDVSVLLITWDRQERGGGTGNEIDGYACDLPTIVDVAGVIQIYASGNERVEVRHDTVFPNIRNAIRVGYVARVPHNLPLVVNAARECQRVPGKRAEVGDNTLRPNVLLLPQERVGGVVGQE
jgi:hypothetical protein